MTEFSTESQPAAGTPEGNGKGYIRRLEFRARLSKRAQDFRRRFRMKYVTVVFPSDEEFKQAKEILISQRGFNLRFCGIHNSQRVFAFTSSAVRKIRKARIQFTEVHLQNLNEKAFQGREAISNNDVIPIKFRSEKDFQRAWQIMADNGMKFWHPYKDQNELYGFQEPALEIFLKENIAFDVT